MDKVSPALTEVQSVKTSCWGSTSPASIADSVPEVTAISPNPGVHGHGMSDIYSVTITDDNPASISEGSDPPITPSSNRIIASPIQVCQDWNADGAVAGTSAPASVNPYGGEVLPSCCYETSPVPPATQDHTKENPINLAEPKNPCIYISLEAADLWQQFCALGTEMIITKSGRRMFPGIAISVSGLELDSKYTLTLEMKPTDNSRFKYLNSKWVVVGKAEAHNEDLLKHVHTDSPASGRHWMANKVSFKKVKLTNNKADKNKRNLVSLNSMHKYTPRLIISKFTSKKVAVIEHIHEFSHCYFIAVTAYQNDQVTQLKIDHNPFAKAFRDSPGDQDMYSYAGMQWPPTSPLLQAYRPDTFYQDLSQGATQFSPAFQLPGHSPSLPQFSATFGNWDSPSYAPGYKSQPSSLSQGVMQTNSGSMVPDQRQILWNMSRLTTESPPISPRVVYSPNLMPQQGNVNGPMYQVPTTDTTQLKHMGTTVPQSGSSSTLSSPYTAPIFPYQISSNPPVGYTATYQNSFRLPTFQPNINAEDPTVVKDIGN